MTNAQVLVAERMLQDYYIMLPELYGPKCCTLNAHLLTHLTSYVRRWGPLWTHSLFGFESMNGHLTSMIHSTRKVGEQLSFSIDVCHVLGSLADRLFEVENDQVLQFLSPLSEFTLERKNMTLLFPGVYSIGSLQAAFLTQDELAAIRKLSDASKEIFSFKRIL